MAANAIAALRGAPLDEPEFAIVPGDDELITTEQLAGEWNVAPSRLHKGRISGADLPPYLKLGHLVRYRRGDVRAWLESQRRLQSTSEMEVA